MLTQKPQRLKRMEKHDICKPLLRNYLGTVSFNHGELSMPKHWYK